jgi:ribosome recycling factor
MEQIMQKFKDEINKTLDFFKNELSGIRSNRPHPGLLENVKVEYYGSTMPLKQMANVQVSPPNCLIVQAWDKEALPALEKAIQAANLGVSTANEGAHIRVVLPSLSKERRDEISSLVKRKAEESRVNLRHLRDDVMNEIKKLFDDKKIGEDDKFRKKDEIQKMVDDFNKQVDEQVKKKEEELSQ